MATDIRTVTMANHDQILRKLLIDIAKEHKYVDYKVKIEVTSSEGANYTSILYNVTLSAPNKNDLELFAKVSNIGEETRTIVPMAIFDAERFMYKDLAETFKSIEQKCGVPDNERYVLPKFYGYNPNAYEETIILENLVAQGYVVYDRLKSVDWPYASKAIETIAKFHALSMAYAEQDPENYGQMVKKLTKEIEPGYIAMSENFSKYIETTVLATREENKERVKKFLDKEDNLGGNLTYRYSKPIRRSVLLHGDFRQSNIMHRVNEDGTVDLILLDYQTMQEGSTAADLLYFIVSGTDAAFRATHYQRLIDHYYDSLKSAMLRLQLDPNKIYPREDFDFELQKILPYGFLTAVLLLPIITIDPENAPDINEDMWESMARPKTSKHYPERLNGIIDDYIKWGLL